MSRDTEVSLGGRLLLWCTWLSCPLPGIRCRCEVGVDTRRQSGHVFNKGAENKARVVTVFFFQDLAMSGDIEAESLFSEKAVTCDDHTVVRCRSMHGPLRYRFGYLWRCVWRCWSTPIARTHKPTARPKETPSEMLVDSDWSVSWATQQDVRARCQQLVCRHAL